MIVMRRAKVRHTERYKVKSTFKAKKEKKSSQFSRHLFVGQRDFDLAVKATGTKQRGVERVGAVRGHDHLDLAKHLHRKENGHHRQ